MRTGDTQALRAIERSTEPARDATPQRAAHLEALQDDIARLRFSLDRLLADPAEVEAIMGMPPSVVRALGLGGATDPLASSSAARPLALASRRTARSRSPRTPPTAPPWRSPTRRPRAPDTVAGTRATTGLTEARARR